MALDFGGWILIFEFLFFLVSVPVGVMIIRKLTQYSLKTDTIVICHDGGKTGGKVIGNLYSKTIGRNGRVHVKFLTRDSKIPEVIERIVEPNKILVWPKGLRSNEKTIMEILSDDSTSYINNLLASLETKNSENSIIYAQKEGLKRAKFHLQNMGEGEISGVDMGLKQGFMENVLKSPMKEEKINTRVFPTDRDRYFSAS